MDEALTIEAALRTAGVATVAVAPAATLTGLWLARREGVLGWLVEALVMAPLVVPPVLTGLTLGWLLGPLGPLGQSLAGLGIDLSLADARLLAIVTAGAMVGLPLFVRAVRHQREAIDERLIHAARSLGAGPVRTFAWITLPYVWRGIAVGAGLAFARALGELGATLVAVRPPGLSDAALIQVGLLSVGVSGAAVVLSQAFARRTL